MDRRRQELRDAHVADLSHVLGLCQEHVAGLDVAVHDLHSMACRV